VVARAAAGIFLSLERESHCPKNLSIILPVTVKNTLQRMAAASRNPPVRICVPRRISR
jgi:hypothetical protein